MGFKSGLLPPSSLKGEHLRHTNGQINLKIESAPLRFWHKPQEGGGTPLQGLGVRWAIWNSISLSTFLILFST